MIRKQDGFSLVELMVALAVFMFIIAAATGTFIPIVNQFKQQSKIAETNTEGIAGLEILRADLEQAGFGLPWYFPNDTINYSEATVAPANSTTYNFNDDQGCLNGSSCVPRAVIAANIANYSSSVNGNANITGIVTGSDYLVIKSTAVTGTATAQKWTYLVAGDVPNVWNYDPYDLTTTERVIVINPAVSNSRRKELVMDGANFSTQFSSPFPANFTPMVANAWYAIYGVDGVDLKRPFNRADYYVGIPANAVRPQRCAQGTGILYKSVLSQVDGTFDKKKTIPLLDCVADMQVIFGLDMDPTPDGIIGTYSDANGSAVSDATSITNEAEGAEISDVQAVLQKNLDLADYRTRVVEVRIYILAHEGQRDPNYTYPNSTILVGDTNIGASIGRLFDFNANGITNWQNYRWKVYSLIVKPQNINMR